MIIWPAKGPGETEDFEFDFSGVLEDGETLSGTPVIVPDGVTVQGSADLVDSATAVQLWLTGGTGGTVAKVSCTVTTSSARTYSEVGVLEIGGEAVSVDQVKGWLRVENSDEDVMIAGLLRAAVRHIERATGKNLVARVEKQTVDAFPGWCRRGSEGIGLWRGPVSEMLSIAYDDGDGAEQTLADFRLIEGSNAKLLPAYGESFPSTASGGGAVRLTYVAGYDPTELPPELTQAVLMLIAHWYQNREAVVAGDRAGAIELPLAVDALISPYRPIGLA